MILAAFLDERVSVVVGDITEQNVDAIVNAANASLLGGGGVDGAIHRNGGPRIRMECEEICRTVYPKGLPTGEAVMTSAGNMQAKYVIHTVGPIYGMNDGNDAELLVKCYSNCLELARQNGLRSIAFPSISTGAYRYPKHEAAFLSSSAIRDFVESDKSFASIKLVFFSEADAKMFVKHSIL